MDLTGDVALQASDDLLLGLALAGAAFDVGAGLWAVAQTTDIDHVQASVGLAIAIETRKGVCRLGPSLARGFGQHSDALRDEVGPYAERLTRELLRSPDHPTPLTKADIGRVAHPHS